MPAVALPALAAVLPAAVAFAGALHAGFVLDDLADVVGNPAATAARFVERLPQTVRPLLKASYAVQDWLHGPWAPGFHAVNLLLHVATTLLLLVLLRRAVRLSAVAVLATALWAVHPALTETVTYVSGRSAGLSALLLLGALVLATGPVRAGTVAAAATCAALAPLARETALVLPALLLWWQLTVGRGESVRTACTRLLPVLAGAAVGASVLAAMPGHRTLVAFSLQARPPLDALRGNVHAMADILGYWAMPWRISIDPPQPQAWGWLELATLVRTAGLAVVGGTALALRRRAPVAAFALGWTLLCLLPSNSLIWRIDPVGLKPLYLASIGPALLLAAVPMRSGGAGRRFGMAAGAGLGVALAAMTVQRTALYADPVALWRDAVDKAPERGRPWIGLGLALLEAGRRDEAAAALAAGLAREPWNPAAREGLALIEATRNIGSDLLQQ
ncbi:MAG: hypothetical protein R3F55_09955 [Alphaproteobacteria bacterium]